MEENLYQEVPKRVARERSLALAIRNLTHERARCAVIREDEVEQVLNFALQNLKSASIEREAREEFQTWSLFHATRVRTTQPSELKVLYLCGPSPLNDLRVLLSHGVDPHNVWAVEANDEIAGQALQQLEQNNVAVKLHNGPLAEFIEAIPETFDLLYLDACGPILGRRPSALAPVLVAATHRRLATQAALVTTFTGLPEDQPAEYASVMASYFRYRYNDFPRELYRAGLDPAICAADDSGLEDAILSNAGACYGEFVTHFLVDVFRGFAPSLRAFASRAFSNAVMAPERKDAMRRATSIPANVNTLEEWLTNVGDTLLDPASYPLFSFYRDLKGRLPQHPLVAQLTNMSLMAAKLPEAICFAEMLNGIIEDHWSLASKDLMRAFGTKWFDADGGFACDVPLPNLLTSSLVGVYGFPKFPVPDASLRIEYVARTRRMYLDVLMLDECRSFFDWWPAVQLVPSRFKSKGFQIVARCVLDRLSWSDWGSASHPFRGGAVACLSEVPAAQPRLFPDRELLPG